MLSTPEPPLSEPPLLAGSAGDVRKVDPSVAAFDASSSDPTDAAASLQMKRDFNMKRPFHRKPVRNLELTY